MKIGDKVWLFATENGNKLGAKVLRMGEYIANLDGQRVIRSNGKIFRRKLSELAKVTGKEKLDFY